MFSHKCVYIYGVCIYNIYIYTCAYKPRMFPSVGKFHGSIDFIRVFYPSIFQHPTHQACACRLKTPFLFLLGKAHEISLHQKGFGKPSQVTFFDQKGQAVGKEWFPNIDLSEKRNNKYMFTKEKPLYKYL